MKVTVAGEKLLFCKAIPVNWELVAVSVEKVAWECFCDEKIGKAEASKGRALGAKGLPRR